LFVGASIAWNEEDRDTQELDEMQLVVNLLPTLMIEIKNKGVPNGKGGETRLSPCPLLLPPCGKCPKYYVSEFNISSTRCNFIGWFNFCETFSLLMKLPFLKGTKENLKQTIHVIKCFYERFGTWLNWQKSSLVWASHKLHNWFWEEKLMIQLVTQGVSH
jgi:hypothetical protein